MDAIRSNLVQTKTEAGLGDSTIIPLQDPGVATGTTARSPLRAWRALLWCEWFAHGKLLLLFLVAWLLLVWLLPFFAHPGWVLLFGGVYALVAGPAYGGGDVVEGCEEFTFGLPATRTERYLARLLIGLGSLLTFTAMDLLALGLDLSQALARLYVDTGLIEPLQVARPGLLYGLVLAFPFAVFSLSFAFAATTHSRALVFTAWFWATLAVLIALRASLQYENLLWNKMNGVLASPALILLGVAALGWGGFICRRKEVGAPVTPLQLPGRWWAWTLLFLLGSALAMFLILWLIRQAPVFFS